MDVNVIDADGRSILEEAFSIADMELAYELVQKGANVNHVNEKTGESLIHLAVQRGDFGAIQFLSKNHADVNIKDKKASLIFTCLI